MTTSCPCQQLGLSHLCGLFITRFPNQCRCGESARAHIFVTCTKMCAKAMLGFNMSSSDDRRHNFNHGFPDHAGKKQLKTGASSSHTNKITSYLLDNFFQIFKHLQKIPPMTHFHEPLSLCEKKKRKFFTGGSRLLSAIIISDLNTFSSSKRI